MVEIIKILFCHWYLDAVNFNWRFSRTPLFQIKYLTVYKHHRQCEITQSVIYVARNGVDLNLNLATQL
jgi:hypothetical protein